MGNWFTLLMAILGFARELFKYLRHKQATEVDKIVEVKELRQDIKKARETGDTQDVEDRFLRIINNKSK